MGNKSGHSGFNASQASKAKAMGVKSGGAPAPMAGMKPAGAMPVPTAPMAMPKGKMPC